ncbi:uncharacterized protein JN550_009865 [Neoarthrinium moseri]|uniref:uncharacterized protein n=1 Tax=Neoarthrinium moseri TaxID=1658444 RepID=UPI001FDBA0E9|nr:uncharacterized protein JN550_009865 [Neoarthrinium moseri]KAI1863129.1 hypothetical protein JN550_009865 [Neoarthrinium moseri]
MAFDPSVLPKDFLVTSFQFTKNVHRDQYPSIDPTKPEIALDGKVVVITGASRGIGAKAFAPAFSKAGVKALVLIATSVSKLYAVEDEVKLINPSIQTLSLAVDITDNVSVEKAFSKIEKEIGHADILINNAGVSNETFGASFADEDPDVFWSNFEVNGKGTYLVTRAFIKSLPNPDTSAVIINMISGAGWVINPSHCAYGVSKLVAQQLTVNTAAAYPNMTIVALNPGLIDTDMVPPPLRPLGFDTPELVGGLAVWLSHPHARFLSGRTLCAHWDVNDLLERKNEIINSSQLRMALVGPFGPQQFR